MGGDIVIIQNRRTLQLINMMGSKFNTKNDVRREKIITK